MSADDVLVSKGEKAETSRVGRFITAVSIALIIVVASSYAALGYIIGARTTIASERSQLLNSYEAKSFVGSAIFDYLGGKTSSSAGLFEATSNFSEAIQKQIEVRPSIVNEVPLFVEAVTDLSKLAQEFERASSDAEIRQVLDRLIILNDQLNLAAADLNSLINKELKSLAQQFYFVLSLSVIAFVSLSYFLILMRTTFSKISSFTSEIMRRLGEGSTYSLPSRRSLSASRLLPGANLIVGETVKLAQMYQGALVKERELFVEQKEMSDKFEATNIELIAAKEETFRAAQLSAIGKVAGSVSHEINNPITGILGYIAYVRKKSTDEDLIKYLGKAQKEVERIGRIAKSLLVFSRHNAAMPSAKFDLASSVENVAVLAGPQLHEALVEIDVAPLGDLPSVNGRVDEFQQCLLNMVLNARDALKSCDEKKIWITARVNTDKVEVLITDSGKGVAEEFREFLFQPFHTTKPAGEGSGLGLSVCRELMNRMGGSAEFDPSYGPGARFILALPIFIEPVTPTPQA